MIHDRDVRPEQAPGAASSPETGASTVDKGASRPLMLGPYTISYLGSRSGLLTLQVNVGRHTVRLFATPDGIAARVSAEIDRWKLARRRKPHRPRICSNDLHVQRWVLAAAAETDVGGAPLWSYRQIAHNLKRARRGEMSREAIRNLVQRLSPTLAKRRAEHWRVAGWQFKKHTPRKNPKRGAALAAEREAVVAELKNVGLL